MDEARVWAHGNTPLILTQRTGASSLSSEPPQSSPWGVAAVLSLLKAHHGEWLRSDSAQRMADILPEFPQGSQLTSVGAAIADDCDILCLTDMAGNIPFITWKEDKGRKGEKHPHFSPRRH